MIETEIGCPHARCELQAWLADGRVSIRYYPRLREFYLPLDGSSAMQLIRFCPWCGTQLPEPLRDKWYDILDEMGLFDPNVDDKERVPDEFWSDKWWKDRGL